MSSSFFLALLLRAGVSAGVVVTATVVAEASGPFWGGLIVSLPIGAGPAYAMLALQHDAAFIAASALGSFAANASTFVYLAAVALLAPRLRWGWALSGGLLAWSISLTVIRQFDWDAPAAMLLNVVVVLMCLAVTRSVGHDPGARPGGPIRRHWFELPARAALVGLMVGSVVTLSRTLGPSLTGMAAVFPVAFTSFTFLVLPRVGGVVGAAIMVSAIRAMPGFALSLLTLYLTAQPLGVAAALVVALLPSLAWSALLMIERGLRLRMA
ncbi:MAG TPA: hypothetical protein VL614_20385 [Acetobacteraceae bacterium]|jgi:uncharacterized membrane protein (GlpM family)|nr:hypothetical protein [Acetobacteraceae bacterium]